MVLYYIAHESLPSMFVLYTDFRYHWGARLTGWALAGIGATSTLVSAVLISLAVKKLGELRTAFTWFLFAITGFALFAPTPNTLIFLIGFPLISLCGLP